MNKAVLCVSFGTSVESARVSITKVENIIKNAAPDCMFVRAFTSSIIRNILHNRGEIIMSVSEAFEYIFSKGIREVLIQPTHILYGNEYDKIRLEISQWSDKFDSLVLGEPLLANSDDLVNMASCLSSNYPAKEDEALILFGHGTNHFSNASYAALQTAFRLINREDVFVGTVEGWPCLDDVINELSRESYKKLRIVPLMLVAGDHALNDMSGNDTSWKSRFENLGYKVECVLSGLGCLEDIQRMYLTKFKKIL